VGHDGSLLSPRGFAAMFAMSRSGPY